MPMRLSVHDRNLGLRSPSKLQGCIFIGHAKRGKPRDGVLGGAWPAQSHGHGHCLSSATANLG